MTKFVDSIFVKKMCKVTANMYRLGWDERNGGNISYRLTEDDVHGFEDNQEVKRTLSVDFDCTQLTGAYFLVTGTGKYFSDISDEPERDLGLVRIEPSGDVSLLWGYNDGGNPTSEFPSHLMSHLERMKHDKEQRVIMHCHPTHFIGMTFTHDLDEKALTKTLWKMQSESLVVFPDGVGVIPWMVPGTSLIGEATASKMAEFHLVTWPHHGIFAAGTSIEETFGLIETVEKAAQIWTVVQAQGGAIKQEITDQELQDLADRFHVIARPGYLDL
ncbi:rhamnulose-1-phosphate aldolase [Sporolactobacillus kofuensis]|uniref:Rhamnulose-1-phosphate aldolase n=1 Tax=Sporolactobacillus kofuensis TaxID=269672 RepID=A0ABW1WBC3_9BACL|nr:rhamnulose-1-phosphate aldolase [Sporolactobacillus kofuensis]MCO7174914.1 rhamnulose-1-phosphate aldolase [Sporolactobacillus kofuensis]